MERNIESIRKHIGELKAKGNVNWLVSVSSDDLEFLLSELDKKEKALKKIADGDYHENPDTCNRMMSCCIGAENLAKSALSYGTGEK